ncbi:FAD-dependent oxidoreductase [Collinsella tanakaei]|uniref:NAD(P)/FAD-dependent oxidoreductase n=1 Tax=Collinsella tanakaei TaxID=626935 RepID=UPI0025A3B6D0|nr:FAD-dependent oxidoreductase [Collinsella tanakaei]MDM8245543.1 FAD-dependent oxidoreductase [Collinsella tanakaei]
MKHVDAVIIGDGPAGLAAAIELRKKGIDDILILERKKKPGGILRQCIHDGFGLTRFGETLSGPEYAARFVREAEALQIPCLTDTTVLEVTSDRHVYASSSEHGMMEFEAGAIMLAMDCRERTRGAISIPGTRPAGVYTAGVAQAYINLKNKMVGRKVVILGSGDVGMIMARRMTLEGAEVLGVFEVQPYACGLPRNVEQCLNDYNIPLSLSHTVTDIRGTDRLKSVVISAVDEHMQPIPGTEKEYECDTLILSVGLIPKTSLPGWPGRKRIPARAARRWTRTTRPPCPVSSPQATCYTSTTWSISCHLRPRRWQTARHAS